MNPKLHPNLNPKLHPNLNRNANGKAVLERMAIVHGAGATHGEVAKEVLLHAWYQDPSDIVKRAAGIALVQRDDAPAQTLREIQASAGITMRQKEKAFLRDLQASLEPPKPDVSREEAPLDPAYHNPNPNPNPNLNYNPE